MIKHSDSKFLPFSASQMYDLVADIEKYPEFLPWCSGARILEVVREGELVIAELLIRFKFFQEKYSSKVSLDSEAKTINVELVEGPFNHLTNNWKFLGVEEGCMVHFDIEFELKSKFLQKMVGGMFASSFEDMVKRFEIRAGEVNLI